MRNSKKGKMCDWNRFVFKARVLISEQPHWCRIRGFSWKERCLVFLDDGSVL